LCVAAKYTDVFEIAGGDLSENRVSGTFQISVDLVEPGKREYPYGWNLLSQKGFKEGVPWIVIS